jgi:DNA-binding response OmpR family regulator
MRRQDLFNILLVEDSIDTQEIVERSLEGVANSTIVPSVAMAISAVKKRIFDLILMDITLDDGNGFELIKLIRNMPYGRNVPVIFLTAKSEIESKITGFQLGAEDYIVKPFNPLELRIRVASRLNKIVNQKPSEIIHKGNLRLEVPLQRVFLVQENLDIELTPLQFRILFSLVNQENTIISRDQFTHDVWGNRSQTGRSIDTHINSLRKKLGRYSHYIQSVYGTGYRFCQGPQ